MELKDGENGFPMSTDALIFPSASHNISRTLSALKQSTLRIQNRLKSIEHDAQFISKLADTYCLPLVANERCGSWYIPPERKTGSAYFKSTDGHQGRWSFSPRRLNLPLLDIIGAHYGCIIVDSTRRGKSMPDALSKTVPIWCAVLNRLLFPSMPWWHALRTSAQVVGRSEHAQIEARLDSFVENAKGLQLDLFTLRAKLKKPLCPMWITQTPFPEERVETPPDSYPVICCTASRRVEGTEASEDGYIQGAGDDSEGWAKGLTPAIFWRYRDQILNTMETDLPNTIADLIVLERGSVGVERPVLVAPTQSVYICKYDGIQDLPVEGIDAVVLCVPNFVDGGVSDSETINLKYILRLRCGVGKLGSRDLRNQLPQIYKFVSDIANSKHPPKMLFACPTGTDLSVGVALAALCLFFDANGTFTVPEIPMGIDKTYIRRRLAWITTSKPESNPSRSTLQAVNAFLMQRPD